MPLLGPDDLPPAIIDNPDGDAPFVLIGDHAGAAIPRAFADLGLSAEDRTRHIAWDIGVAAVGALLAERLDAVFVHQLYSRLVIDCNRDPARPDAMPDASDGTMIAANLQLSPDARQARIDEVHAPYQAAIARALGARPDAVLVALHSFTPVMGGLARPWHAGILHDRGDDRFALALLAALRAEPDLIVGDNEPYAMAGLDYTVPRHAITPGRRYAEVELRQDLIAAPAGQRAWADRLARLLPSALRALG